MDLNSSPCRLRPRLLICGPLSLSVSGLACLVESVSREKELESITSSAAMPLLASEDKNPGQIASFCQDELLFQGLIFCASLRWHLFLDLTAFQRSQQGLNSFLSITASLEPRQNMSWTFLDFLLP